MSYYVFSTLATDQIYQNWMAAPSGMPAAGHSVFVKGGTGVANERLITPIGVMTEISDADYTEMQKNEVFKLHVKNGYVTVQSKKAEPEKVASGMNTKDKSAPKTDADFEAETGSAPKVK